MKNSWYILTSIIIVFLNFSPFKLGDTSITFTLLILPLWNILTFTFSPRVKIIHLLILLILVILPYINIEFKALLQFMRTYTLYIIFLLQLFILFSMKINKNIRDEEWRVHIYILQLLIIGYSLFQFVLLKYFNIGSLFNPWGTFQAFNMYDYNLHLDHIRATGFYLEPSVLGFVIIMLFWIRHISEFPKIKINFIITLIGIYVTGSMSAYITFLILMIYLSSCHIKSTGLKLILLIFTILLILNILPYIPRIGEYSAEGSSTYWRFVAPLIILADLLPNHLLGMPFGSYKEIVSSYGLYNGTTIGNSIDNGHLLLIYYFGLLTILPYLYLLYKFAINKNYAVRSYIIYLVFTYNFTGAIFSVEYFLLIFILPIIAIKLSRNKYVDQYNNNHI